MDHWSGGVDGFLMKRDQIKVDRRRQLIFRQAVLDNTPLPLKRLQEWLDGEKYDADTAQTDVEAFAKVGCNLKLQKCRSDPSDKEIVFLEGPHIDNDNTRESIHAEEKALVARLAASLICGTPTPFDPKTLPGWTRDLTARAALDRLATFNKREKRMATHLQNVLAYVDEQSKPSKGQTAIESFDSVLELISRTSITLERKEELRKSLSGFWNTTSRMVAIDSGTTNIALCKYLEQMPIPLVKSQLCSLTVCTNSRRIFEALGPSWVWVKTMIIGGQQMFRSPTIAGPMAEVFLRSVPLLQFGICILGSTRIDIDRGVICSDTQEESSLKNLLMERSALRVVCVDNSKLQKGPGRQGYRFASIDPIHIDLILTNNPIRRRSLGAIRDYEAFRDKVDAIQDRGVPVLLASSPTTFGYMKKQMGGRKNPVKKYSSTIESRADPAETKKSTHIVALH